MGRMRGGGAACLVILTVTVSLMTASYSWAQMAPGEGGPTGRRQNMDHMRQFMQTMLDAFTDKEHGGVYTAVSEDFQKVVDPGKLAFDQFTLGRSYIFQHMGSGQPQPKDKAVELVDFALRKFEDADNGAYYRAAAQDWTIVGKEKDPALLGEIFGIMMHLYEITYDDAYLLKGFDILDVMIDKGEDKDHGGFFDSYAEDWTPIAKTKSLETQMQMIQHLGGAWKDGIDSPYAVRAESYKQKSIELGNLVVEKMADPEHGGFYKTCNADWSVKDDSKDPKEIASAIMCLFFSYHNRGPVIWGPRKGSHAYNAGRVIHDVYSYRGPGPDPRPVSMDAYRLGKLVPDTARLLVEKAWDGQNGGFYRSLSRDWQPTDKTKSAATQAAVLFALNIAYKMTGEATFRKALSETVGVLLQKASDPQHGGYYESYGEAWAPAKKEKTFAANMQVLGIVGMVMPTINGPEVSPLTLKVWIEPATLTIKDGEAGQYTVTIQNQGFSPEKVRLGGMFAFTRWMDPQESVIDLGPHQVHTYNLSIKPPKGLAGKSYPFEISAVGLSDRSEYVSDLAILNIQ